MGARLQAADIVVPRACEGSSTKTATDGTLPSGTVPTHKFLPGDGSKQCRNLDMQTRAVAVAVAGVSEKNKHMEKSSVHSVVDPFFWTRKRPFLRWWAALKIEESQCPKPARVTHLA
jgi:hypothetical protein